MTARQFKAARKTLGLTQRELGEYLGKSVRMVKYYEAGQTVPFLVADKLKRLVEIGVPTN